MKLAIFNTKIEILYFSLILLAIFLINICFKFVEFNEFRKNSFMSAEVLSYYPKTGQKGRYYVAKLKADNFIIYTTTRKNFNLKSHDFINVNFNLKQLDFLDFLKRRFYAYSYKISKISDNQKMLENSNFKQKAKNFIEKQHENPIISELYSALYFASGISNELRKSVNSWGIAHVISISGFHLGIIFAFLFAIFSFIYRPFQKHYFPYRSVKFDVSMVVFAIMIFYLFVLDFTPSFLRSLSMALLGFYLLIRNFKIINFTTLFMSVAILIAIFPHLAFSVGFYFSALGVLYIFLYIHHISPYFNAWQNVVLFNIYVWLCMNVAVYYFFPFISLQQLSVIPISYIFVIFYPLSIFFHIFAIGWVFDGFLEWFLNFKIPNFNAHIPFWLFCVANVMALLGIRYLLATLCCAILGASVCLFVV